MWGKAYDCTRDVTIGCYRGKLHLHYFFNLGNEVSKTLKSFMKEFLQNSWQVLQKHKINNDLETEKKSKKPTGYYLHLENKFLCFFKNFTWEETDIQRVVLPSSLQLKVLTLTHASYTSINKTLQNIESTTHGKLCSCYPQLCNIVWNLCSW